MSSPNTKWLLRISEREGAYSLPSYEVAQFTKAFPSVQALNTKPEQSARAIMLVFGKPKSLPFNCSIYMLGQNEYYLVVGLVLYAMKQQWHVYVHQIAD